MNERVKVLKERAGQQLMLVFPLLIIEKMTLSQTRWIQSNIDISEAIPSDIGYCLYKSQLSLYESVYPGRWRTRAF